jgi:5-methylcytosine-specific restriction protein A
MGLRDLSDPGAVRQAVAEFDRIGRRAFLDKYDIDQARGWLLIDQERGREYDAKAIAGAAHGYQHPHQGPLSADEFHGGEATARVLRKMGFVIQEPGRGRNPPWTRDELILALDLYMRHRPSLLDDRHPAVIELSDLLGRLATLDGRAVTGTRFRNANGVAMKLGNLARLDPISTAAGRRGLTRGGKGDEEVWRDFASNPEGLRATASAIRAALEAGEVPRADDEGEDDLSLRSVGTFEPVRC